MSDLFSKNEKDYGSDYKEHLFEQYKLYVESISLIGLSFQIKFFENIAGVKSVLAFLGIVICIVFWFLIRSYKQLNTGKFAVIHEIEKQLPLALYKYEWEVLGKGEDNKKYYPFSHIELIIPWVFGIIYALIGLYFLL